MIKVSRLSEDTLEKFKHLANGVPYNPDRLYLGASIDDIPCGLLIAVKNNINPEICNINFIFVHPIVRRMGTATCLVETLINECKKTGYKKITLKFVSTKEELDEFNLFFQNCGFEALKVTNTVYIMNRESLYSSGKIGRFINTKNIAIKGIEIIPWDRVSNKLFQDLKNRVNIDYPDIYEPFHPNNKLNIDHINSYVAISNSNEIVAWLTGFDANSKAILYDKLFVKPQCRKLALGVVLLNYCIKNHVEKFRDRSAFFGVDLSNVHAENFYNAYFKGIDKEKEYEFFSEKTIK